MQHIINKEIDVWYRPWDLKYPDYTDHDERYFSILVKGTLNWLNSNIIMYGKSIRHFIFNTGSNYVYLENNGNEFTWCETTGENLMYMETPRCICTLGSISVPTEELTSLSVRGVYERKSSLIEYENQIKAYSNMIRRIPIELELNLKYIFSTFNESIIFAQELIEKLIFQKYFNIIYLGQTIRCSIEFSNSVSINMNQIDLSSKDPNQKNIDINIKICSNMPIFDENNETLASNVISNATGNITNNENILGKYKMI